MEDWNETASRILFLAFCGLIVAVGLWFNVEPHACPVPQALLSTDTSVKPACFEFWFNRYQTIIGALATIGAAWYAGYWVAKQVRRTDHQIALSRAQLSSEFISTVEVRITAARRLYEQVRAINNVYFEIEEAILGCFQAAARTSGLSFDDALSGMANGSDPYRNTTQKAQILVRDVGDTYFVDVSDYDLQNINMRVRKIYHEHCNMLHARFHTQKAACDALYKHSREMSFGLDHLRENSAYIKQINDAYCGSRIYGIQNIVIDLVEEIHRLDGIIELSYQQADDLITSKK